MDNQIPNVSSGSESTNGVGQEGTGIVGRAKEMAQNAMNAASGLVGNVNGALDQVDESVEQYVYCDFDIRSTIFGGLIAVVILFGVAYLYKRFFSGRSFD